ncbi:GNAT family N-acetyltransferase [Mesorhizobium microcysteis]|uniref:GNAT family N-acetyltransferase n=1 Tax=Neoaquamicrobium microcysteis TaxID=2682781 RepID=A0A5D4GVX4_9HYPH|nr:GNAT family N-acetyltransferase [Mesorhizobium microcysteis]TYR32866.1 GNAT family N-acetyltransferase [Mesorhizobium microcysteis]
MIGLETERLVIRNWEDRDRDLFHRINSDDGVMRFFPFRRTRAEADAFLDRIRTENDARGYGFAALELKQTGECLGFAGLHPTDEVPARSGGATEIGWRLAPKHWRKGYVTEAAEELLRFGFETLALDEIVSFAVWNNDASTAVMRRIGMKAEPEGDFDHPRVPDTYPHLQRHVLYTLSRMDWLARR